MNWFAKHGFKWLVFGGLIVALASSLFAQSKKEITGLVWRKMRYDNKFYWLNGYIEGLEKAEEIIDLEVTRQREKEFGFTEPFYVNQLRTKIVSYLPAKRYAEIDLLIELLDNFYEDKYNQKIQIEAAIRIVLARQRGETEQADFWLNAARRAIYQKTK